MAVHPQSPTSLKLMPCQTPHQTFPGRTHLAVRALRAGVWSARGLAPLSAAPTTEASLAVVTRKAVLGYTALQTLRDLSDSTTGQATATASQIQPWTIKASSLRVLGASGRISANPLSNAEHLWNTAVLLIGCGGVTWQGARKTWRVMAGGRSPAENGG